MRILFVWLIFPEDISGSLLTHASCESFFATPFCSYNHLALFVDRHRCPRSVHFQTFSPLWMTVFWLKTNPWSNVCFAFIIVTTHHQKNSAHLGALFNNQMLADCRTFGFGTAAGGNGCSAERKQSANFALAKAVLWSQSTTNTACLLLLYLQSTSYQWNIRRILIRSTQEFRFAKSFCPFPTKCFTDCFFFAV